MANIRLSTLSIIVFSFFFLPIGVPALMPQTAHQGQEEGQVQALLRQVSPLSLGSPPSLPSPLSSASAVDSVSPKQLGQRICSSLHPLSIPQSMTTNSRATITLDRHPSTTRTNTNTNTQTNNESLFQHLFLPSTCISLLLYTLDKAGPCTCLNRAIHHLFL